MKKNKLIFDYKYKPNDTYILACSFGPDSMALFDLLYCKNIKFVVAHVNYHKREESNYEENSLKKYCKERNIICEVLDTTSLSSEGNFQEWARELRYKFFASLEKKYSATGTFVAHNQDDLIETYLIQRKRNGRVKYFGIQKENKVLGANIIRPLLKNKKIDLQKYCDENIVPYSIDKSNLTDHYLRNKFRHEILTNLTDEERENIIIQIDLANESNKLIENSNMIFEFIERYFKQFDEHTDISSGFLFEIEKQLKSKKANLEIKLTKNISIFKEYGEIIIVNKSLVPNYRYELKQNTSICDKLFEYSIKNSDLERNIETDDFPITIKPVNSDDLLLVSNHKKPMRRLFIDWKVPLHLRERWPGIYNKNGDLIYVPRYRTIYEDNHQNKLIIKFTNKEFYS